jgi:hypothetical protein
LDEGWFEHLILTWPIWLLGLALLAILSLAAAGGYRLRRAHDAKTEDAEDSQEGYIFSAVAGLLALLMGFTFTMAVDRFDARRALVREEASAIGQAYLQTQLLPEPHKARISALLKAYAYNRIQLGRAARDRQGLALLARNDTLIAELWSATVAAWDSIKSLDFSSAYVESMNGVVHYDWERKTARTAHVPTAIFGVQTIYLAVTAVVLGYLLRGRRARLSIGVLLVLFTLSLMLIVDIDRPVGGRVVESQRPMEDLGRFIAEHPPESFGSAAPRSPSGPV